MSQYIDHSGIPAARNFTDILGPDGYVSYETILEMLSAGSGVPVPPEVPDLPDPEIPGGLTLAEFTPVQDS